MAGQRDEYKAGGDRNLDAVRGLVETVAVWRFSLKQAVRGHRLRTGSSFWSGDSVEVKGLSSDWLHCFSDRSASTPQYLIPCFY